MGAIVEAPQSWQGPLTVYSKCEWTGHSTVYLPLRYVLPSKCTKLCCRSGKHLIVFLERGPLYLVAVSSAAEPESALRLQLELLHAHFLAILTDNFDRMLARNPRFEPRRLLGVCIPRGSQE